MMSHASPRIDALKGCANFASLAGVTTVLAQVAQTGGEGEFCDHLGVA